MNLNKLFPDKDQPLDQKDKHWKNLLFGYGAQLIKPVVGIGAATTVFEMYKTDPMAAATFASIGLLSYWTVNMIKTDFAKNMLAQTKVSEWDAVTYSKKHFKDKSWNRRYHPSVGPTLSAAHMYNHFVVKHNAVMDFVKFDTLVQFGIQAAIRLSNFHDELFQRFQAASRAIGVWEKFQTYLDPIRNVVPANKTTMNIFEQVKEIAPTIEGFTTSKSSGPRNDLFRFNEDVINTSSERYILNNTYFSFATLHAEIVQAIHNNDSKTIKSLTGKDGIGKFINLLKYTGNKDFEPLHHMAKSLLQVMDNYRANDVYHFPLASEYNHQSSIQDNAEAIFANLSNYVADTHKISLERPIAYSEEIFRQMRPSMEKFLVKNMIDSASKDNRGLDAERMESEIFPKSKEAADRFIRKMEDKFSIDIEV